MVGFLANRRAFLKKMALALVAFVPALRAFAGDAHPRAPEPVAEASPAGVTPTPPPPPAPGDSLLVDKYVTGKVIAVEEGRITVAATYAGKVVLHIGPQAAIWKGEWNGDLPIEVGDDVKAWGDPLPGSAYRIEKMWANIVNLHGTVSEVAPQPKGLRLLFHEQSLGPCTVTIDERTLVSQGSAVAAFDGSLHLQRGQSLQIIGLALKDGSIRATRLLL